MKRIHWYYKFLILFLIFFSMFFFLNKNMSKIVNSSPYKNYVNFISVPIEFIDKYNIFRYKSIILENEKLNKEVLIQNTAISDRENLIKEVEELRNLLKLENIYTSHDKIYAKTTTRNKMYWYSTITIDKGSLSGVKEGDAVVTKNGLIGQIKSVTKDYSSVKLITNSDTHNKISVMVKVDNKTKIGTITGYKYPCILVELTTDKKGIKKGDKLITSGLGNFPKNIYIGEIKKIEKDSYNLSNILYVQPKQDMNDINYVAVLKSK